MKFWEKLKNLKQYTKCKIGKHDYTSEWFCGDSVFHQFSTCNHCGKHLWRVKFKNQLTPATNWLFTHISKPIDENFYKKLEEYGDQ